MTIRISVVIPCYNRQHCIGEAIESVLSQTYPIHEIIVVDDGSKDDSARVAQQFGDPVTVIRTENRGGSAARNRGIDEASGDWLAFLDSDDTWAENKIARQVAAIEKFPRVGLVFCDQELVRGEEILISSRFGLGGVRENAVSQDGAFYSFGADYFKVLLTRSRIFTSAVIARADLRGLRFPEGYAACQDWPVWLQLARETSFVAVDEVLVRMTSGDDNVTKNRRALFRYSLKALKALMHDTDLPHDQFEACKEAYASRCVGATFYGTWLGDKTLAREAISGCSQKLGPFKHTVYQLLLMLPAPILCHLGRNRLQRLTHGPDE